LIEIINVVCNISPIAGESSAAYLLYPPGPLVHIFLVVWDVSSWDVIETWDVIEKDCYFPEVARSVIIELFFLI